MDFLRDNEPKSSDHENKSTAFTQQSMANSKVNQTNSENSMLSRSHPEVISLNEFKAQEVHVVGQNKPG
jgi:hypothetical protein